MFDNVTIKAYGLPKNYVPCGNVVIKYRTDVNTFQGNIGNMGIYKNLNCLIIHGSLAKYLHNENITPLNREEVRQAMEKLEQDIGLNLEYAVVASVEFGTSIITKEKPFEYLNLFGNKKRLTRVEYSRWTGVETIIYTSDTGSYEFIGYDKFREMRKKKQEIPPMFTGSNVLRLEYRIRKRRGINAIFKRDLLAYDLFSENIYKRFQKLFLDAYKSIDKVGRLVYTNKSKNMTPVKLQKLQAEQFRQSFPKDYRYFIQQLTEAKKLTPISLARIQAENHKLGHDMHISEQSTLIKELDALVFDRAIFGT